MRTAKIERNTKETQIKIELGLDGVGNHNIHTGIGFLDHMLAALAVHGLFDLIVHAQGDLHIDVHHTVEDIAIVLGQAFDQALADRKGIQRTAHSYVPMDETLAFVAVDLSGRPYSVFKAEFDPAPVGALPTTLFERFSETFAMHCKCNLPARVEYGRDDHHKAEALFKALARALDSATQVDPRRGGIPSTKGVL